MKKTTALLITALFLSGCGTVLAARQGSFADQAYALEADYIVIQSAAAQYVVRPDADPWTKRHIKETNRRANTALDILGDMAEGGALPFCIDGKPIAVPSNSDRAFAELACDGNMPAVLAKTAGIVGLLNSIVIELGAE